VPIDLFSKLNPDMLVDELVASGKGIQAVNYRQLNPAVHNWGSGKCRLIMAIKHLL